MRVKSRRPGPSARAGASAPGAGAPGLVRIVGGHWRGTRLPVPGATGLRPTPDRVRETLFNWLGHARPSGLRGARVLDLFAGSGALGLEALSRGAHESFLVERDRASAATLRASVQRLRADARAHVVEADALDWLRAPLHGRFDLVFLDPPFEAALWDRVLPLLPPWLDADAWLYLESPADGGIRPGPDWAPHREGRTREVHYALYRRRPATP